MIRELHLRLKKWISELNLFEKSSSNEQTLGRERFATRIFLISFLCLLIIISIISSLILHTVNKSESSPYLSRFEYLLNKYPKALNCPCSKIGITYSTFVTINVEFHQVCSSQFILKPWIESVFAQRNTLFSESDDFHQILSFFWQIIADFCTISNQSLNAAIINFNSSFILTPTALSKDVIENQIYSDLNIYIQSIQTKLAQHLLAVQRTIAGNQYVSALTNNFYFVSSTEQNSLRMSPKQWNNCSCMRITGCPHPAMINETIIPGMIMDCYLIDATLSSTLECYYNQTCFSLLHPSMSMKLLSTDKNKQFSFNSTIQSLLEKLMIDNLTIIIHFDLFYDHCKPVFCSYSYSHRFDILFIITTLISSFGVLSFILPFIVQLIVMIIFGCKGNNSNRSVKEIIINECRSIFGKIININLFENGMTDEKYIYEQRIIIIFSKQEQLITISEPTEEDYQNLYEKYNSTLVCPCSQISIPYETFLNVTFLLHQICSSNLVSIQWINYLSSFNPMNVPDWIVEPVAKDFRVFGTSYFEFLQIFCLLANLTIENTQKTFLTTELISKNLLSPDIFQQKTTDLMDIFVRTTQNTFIEIYQWLQVINTINLFITGTKSNFDGYIENNQVLLMDLYLNQGVFIRDGYVTGAGVVTFYRQCAPQSCSYTIIQRRQDFILLLFLLISTSQGLNQILRLSIPLLSQLILSYLRKFLSSNRSIVRISTIQRFKRLLKSIRYFNLFRSDKKNAISLSLQLIYTRVYLILFTICLIILIFYNSIIDRTRTIVTSNPNLEDYQQLLKLYPDNVNCPCTQITIPYAQIITELNVTSFHQVCTTSLLGNMVQLGRFSGSTTVSDGLKFDSWRYSFLNGLTILCSLSQNYVKNNIEMLLSSTMLAYQTIPRNIFHQQINTTITRFQNELPITFNQTLELIRATNHDNALIAFFPSNWNIFVADDNISFLTSPVIYNLTDMNTTCSCATERSCTMPVILYDFESNMYVNLPEGVVYSCTLVEIILHSSLFCFYSKTCVLRYRQLSAQPPLRPTYFDQITANIFNSSLTRFAMNDTIETMVSSMFIESWSSNTSYENFFETCSPSQCISTYRYRFDIIEIFTIFLSIYAGLALILRFLIPHLFTIINKIRNCNRVQPLNTS
ncbi:hypothetical protein I4U23_004889 [Adineta vaga]|nr:hypothetical protein I4U23_004889 [Adineta vaga]